MPNSIDSQQRILDSARELIYARSYADVGVAEICDHAGVKKGSFYHFFPSKRDLTLSVLDQFYLEFKQGLIKNSFEKDIPPLARLIRLCHLAYDFQSQIFQDVGHVLGCPFGNLAIEMATQSEPIRVKIAHIFSNLQSGLRSILHEAIETGEVQGIDVEATSQAMLAYFEGVMLMAKTQNNIEVIKQLLPAMAEIRIKLP